MSTAYYNVRGYKGFWSRIFLPVTPEDEQYANEAEELLGQYLRTLSYNKKTLLSFTIHIEKPINYSKQSDTHSDYGWDLQCHIDYDAFVNADRQGKTSLILTACQLLLEFKTNEPGYAQRGVDYLAISQGLQQYLQDQQLYHDDCSFFFKPATNTRFKILSVTGPHADGERLKFDLHKFESSLTNMLVHKQFGSGLRDVYFRFGIFKFDGAATSYFEGADKQLTYSAKAQSLVISRNVNYNVIVQLDEQELLDYYREMFKENIELISASKKVSKKFDLTGFLQSFQDHLDAYVP